MSYSIALLRAFADAGDNHLSVRQAADATEIPYGPAATRVSMMKNRGDVKALGFKSPYRWRVTEAGYARLGIEQPADVETLDVAQAAQKSRPLLQTVWPAQQEARL